MTEREVEVKVTLPVEDDEIPPNVASRAKRLLTGFNRKSFNVEEIDFTWKNG